MEAWKKATADYKAASIPLGQFDFSGQRGVENSPYGQQGGNGNGNGMPGISRNGSSGQTSISGAGNRASWARHQKAASQQLQIQQGGHVPGAATQTDAQLSNGEIISTHVKSFHYEASSYWFRISAIFMPDDPASQAISLVLYRLYEDFYNFQITLLDLFPSEAGRSESSAPGSPLGSPPAGRILPYMPGPLDKVDVDVTNTRREELDTYLKELLDLRNIGAGYVLRHEHVLGFFSPGQGDQAESMDRLDAEGIAMRTMREGGGGGGSIGGSGGRISGISGGIEERLADMRVGDDGRGSAGSGRYSPMPSSNGQQGQGFEGRGSGGSGPRSQSRQSGHGSAGSGGPPSAMSRIIPTRNDSGSNRGNSPIPPAEIAQPLSGSGAGGLFSPPPQTGSTSSSFGGGGPGQGHTRNGSNVVNNPPAAQPPYIKIKILERTTDDMIAIRVPPKVTYEQLMQKVRDRLGSQVGRVQYRQSGGAFRDVLDDASLGEWLGKEEKLVLYAD